MLITKKNFRIILKTIRLKLMHELTKNNSQWRSRTLKIALASLDDIIEEENLNELWGRIISALYQEKKKSVKIFLAQWRNKGHYLLDLMIDIRENPMKTTLLDVSLVVKNRPKEYIWG